ncbi:MAG: hypothetical protein KDN05_00615 [Verrucomicrobiae bacterium]|nr:hypothetical protein [Verrucomicrobiae bacterium]
MKSRPLLFIAPGCIMLIAGFGLMLAAAVSGRLSSEAALPLPFGFTTAATGAMLLTRTPLAVFFLFIYAAAVLVIACREVGFLHPVPLLYLALIGYCLPLAKHAKA